VNWEFDDGGLSEREKKIAAYKKIQGRYEGVIELGSRVISTRVTVSYIQIQNGVDVNNRPRFNVLLTLRLSRPELIVNDVTLQGDFDPLNRVVTGADPSLSGGGVGGGVGGVGAPLPGGQQAEAFYFSGRVYEKDPLELVGELRTKEQFYGRLRVVRVFEQVPSPADLDEELFNQILNLLKPLEGRYHAEHLTDKLEVLNKFEIRVVTGSGRLPSLMINYRRNEFTAAVTANLLYRPGFTPPKLSFSTSYSAGPGGVLMVSFDGELKPDGTIQGVLTHGNLSGPLRAKKLAP
jgi:hypothetical protein